MQRALAGKKIDDLHTRTFFFPMARYIIGELCIVNKSLLNQSLHKLLATINLRVQNSSLDATIPSIHILQYLHHSFRKVIKPYH